MIAEISSNRKRNQVVTKLFISWENLVIPSVFIKQTYFIVSKDVKLNDTHFFTMTIPNKRKPQQIAINYLPDNNAKDFISIYKKETANQYLFLPIDTNLYQIILYVSERII